MLSAVEWGKLVLLQVLLFALFALLRPCVDGHKQQSSHAAALATSEAPLPLLEPRYDELHPPTPAFSVGL